MFNNETESQNRIFEIEREMDTLISENRVTESDFESLLQKWSEEPSVKKRLALRRIETALFAIQCFVIAAVLIALIGVALQDVLVKERVLDLLFTFMLIICCAGAVVSTLIIHLSARTLYQKK